MNVLQAQEQLHQHLQQIQLCFFLHPPSGLTPCETTAVQNFINTTLSAHEQQHVAKFNGYTATINTPYTFTGCVSGLQAHIQAMHDRIEVA